MATTNGKLQAEIRALRDLSTDELRALHFEAYGEETKVRNKDYLFKRLAYWLQQRAGSPQQVQHNREGARVVGRSSECSEQDLTHKRYRLQS